MQGQMAAEVVTQIMSGRERRADLGIAVLHSDDRARGAAAALAQARRHLHRARQPRRHRRLRRRTRWPVQRRHALLSPVSRLMLDEHAAAAARLESARRQLGADRRPHQSRLSTDGGRLVLQKDTLHIVAHDLPVAGHRLSAHRRCKTTATGRASFDLTLLFDNDFADLFEVRGAAAARRGIGLAPAARPRSTSLLDYQRARRQCADHALHLRSGADRARGQRGDLSSRTGAGAESTSLFVAVSCNKPVAQRAGAVLPRPARRIAARCGGDGAARPASKPPTTSSTRCCAGRWPTSTC